MKKLLFLIAIIVFCNVPIKAQNMNKGDSIDKAKQHRLFQELNIGQRIGDMVYVVDGRIVSQQPQATNEPPVMPLKGSNMSYTANDLRFMTITAFLEMQGILRRK